MATVVNVPKDPRFEELGTGVAKFLNRMKETRLDKLQQDLMRGISAAEDEASAAALLADPRYQDVVNNSERFARIDAHLTNAQPGQETFQGYNDEGEQVFFSKRKGTPTSNADWDARGLHVSPEQAFYINDPDNPEALPTLLGHFRGRGDALEEAQAKFGLSEASIYNQAEAQMEMQRASQTGQARRAEESLGITKEQFAFAKAQPSSAVGQVMEDFRDGQFGDPNTQEAVTLRDAYIEKLLFKGYGATQFDVADKSKEDLTEEGAAVMNLSRRGTEMIQMVVDDPKILSRVGGLDRFAESISAEFTAIGQFSGITKLPLDQYDFGSFNAQSRTFKNMLVDFAIAVAAAKGIKGRDLSNQEFDKFLGIVGTDINDPAAFVTNMSRLMRTTQEDFRTRWRIMQEQPTGGAVQPFETTHGAFPTFQLDEDERNSALVKALQDKAAAAGFELVLPPGAK